MSSLLWFLFGLVLGFIIFWTYSWITDKLNMLKLTYKGCWYLYNNYIKKKI